MEQMFTLKARLLGSAECSIEGKDLDFVQQADSKAGQLLMLLVYYSREGVSRTTVVESLYRGADVDVANSLKALMFRLRRSLREATGTNEVFLELKDGRISLTDRVKVESDVRTFMDHIDAAEQAEGEEKIRRLEEACRIYRGELLPRQSTENWVVFENAFLEEQYKKAVKEICAVFNEHEDYSSAYNFYKRALLYFPYDEDWAVGCIHSLSSLKLYEQALTEYEEIASSLYEEMGMNPSEKLVKAMKDVQRLIAPTGSPRRRNEEEKGALFCSYESFRDSYRILSRIIGRDKIEMSLVIYRAVRKDGSYIRSKREQATAMAAMRIAMERTLRRSDMCARFDTDRMIVMLWGTPAECVEIVTNRIIKRMDSEDLKGICTLEEQLVKDPMVPSRPVASLNGPGGSKWKKIGETRP